LTRYQRCRIAGQGTLPPLAAGDFAAQGLAGGGGDKAMKAMQRVAWAGVDVEKILTPADRADKAPSWRRWKQRLCKRRSRASRNKALREFLAPRPS